MSQRGRVQSLAVLIMALSHLIGCVVLEADPTLARTRVRVPTLADSPTPIITPKTTSTAASENVPSLNETPTDDPCTGWWCAVAGVVYSGTTASGNEWEGASVTLNQSSYCSTTRGQHRTTTRPDGTFEFGEVFFHDTDRIQLQVVSEGYEPILWDSTDFYCLFCVCFRSPIQIILNSAAGP